MSESCKFHVGCRITSVVNAAIGYFQPTVSGIWGVNREMYDGNASHSSNDNCI